MANDIGNAITSADKAGNWWILHANGATDTGSSVSFSPQNGATVSPITLDGVNQYLKSANVAFPTAGQAFSVVCVFQPFSVSSGQPFYCVTKWPGANQTFIVGVYASNPVLFVIDNTSTFHAATHSATILPGQVVVMGASVDPGTNTLKVRYGGVTVSASALATLGATTSDFEIGATNNNAVPPPALGIVNGAFYTEKLLSDADFDRIFAMVAPTNPWLTLNGLETSGIASAPDSVKGERREIGERAPASDGSLRVTVQNLKRDLSFRTTILSAADAYAWECLLRGEGHVWQFEGPPFGLYSCKGSVPQDTTGCTIVSGSSKFGAKKLRINTGQFQTDTDALTNMSGAFNDYTVMFWKSTDSGATWHHYVLRSDGSKWVDGAPSGASFAAFLTIGGSGDITLSSNADFDDLVTLPFKVPDTWPALFYARTTAYPNTPFLEAAGAMVPEQAIRLVAGAATDVTLKTAASKTGRRLDVTLTAK